MIPARQDLRCESQNAFPTAEIDLLAAADWLFPHGMDHHRLMTGSRIGNQVFLKMVREMGGTGLLPGTPALEIPPVTDESCDLCIVGAGPAGLSAAVVVAKARPETKIVVIDEQDIPGGSLLAEPGGVEASRRLAEDATSSGTQLWLSSAAVGFYPEDGAAGVLAVATPHGLVRLSARRFLYATGAYDQNLPFPGNDKPNVLSARGCGRLAFRWGVKPAEQVVIVMETPLPFIEPLVTGLTGRGVSVAKTSMEDLPRTRDHACVLAVAATPSPASELARHHGARVHMDVAAGGFVVEVNSGYESTASGVFAAGDVIGFKGTGAAAHEGRAAGLALAERL